MISFDPLTHIPDAPLLHLDWEALAHNWRAVQRACPGGRVGAVVKNDAYGLGLTQAAPRLWALGCRDFWVATWDEALQLRACLPAPTPERTRRIFVLHGLAGQRPADCAALGLTPVLAGAHELAALAGASAQIGARLPVALHLDTGLTRLGFGAEDLPLLQPDAALWQDAQPLLWVTHLGRFHDPEASTCQTQRQRFIDWCAQLPACARSIATSSSVFTGRDWHFEHARVGSALWGVPTGTHTPAHLRPIAHLHAPVLRVAEVAAGVEIGYAGGYTTPTPRRIATVALGYADGLPFGLVNRGHLVLHGQRAPIVGGVAMGMLALDVSDFAPGQVQPGQWAEVYGAEQSLGELAQAAGVAPNVLLTLSARQARRTQAESTA